jgi:C1A family cysteine protease
MMFQLLFLFMLGANALNLTGDSEWSKFVNFQKDFEKNYISLDELEVRFKHFTNTLSIINEHNLDKTQTFQMDINQFSDLSSEEFQMRFLGGFKQSNMTSLNVGAGFGAAACNKFTGTPGKLLPSMVDWTTLGKTTAVKDQGYCGSCWSFSAAEAIESAWAIKKGQLLTLSEQQLVDCSKKYGNMGCNGGLMDSAFHYVMDNGLCLESAYPYTSGKSSAAGTCQTTCLPAVTISGCADTTPNNQITLKEAVSIGPVSIAIQADSKIFQSYTSGIITGTSCGQTLDHGVVITGYGIGTPQENNVMYWKVRNSWSASWGEAGYVRIERSEKTNDAGTCGIAMQPSFPIV